MLLGRCDNSLQEILITSFPRIKRFILCKDPPKVFNRNFINNFTLKFNCCCVVIYNVMTYLLAYILCYVYLSY